MNPDKKGHGQILRWMLQAHGAHIWRQHITKRFWGVTKLLKESEGLIENGRPQLCTPF